MAYCRPMGLLTDRRDEDDEEGLPSYRQKPRPIGFEIAYKLEGDILVIDTTRKIDRVRLAAVEQVRFIFKPGNVASTGYLVRLRLSDGKTIDIGDTSWRSMVEVERGGARFVRFIEALCAAILRASPKVRFVAGKPPLIWALYLAVAAVSIVAILLFVARSLGADGGGAVWIGLLILGAALWQMIPLVWLNRPMALEPGQIPPHLMPKPEVSG